MSDVQGDFLYECVQYIKVWFCECLLKFLTASDCLTGRSSLLLWQESQSEPEEKRYIRDMGKLAEQIALMSEGESIPEELRLFRKIVFP